MNWPLLQKGIADGLGLSVPLEDAGSLPAGQRLLVVFGTGPEAAEWPPGENGFHVHTAWGGQSLGDQHAGLLALCFSAPDSKGVPAVADKAVWRGADGSAAIMAANAISAAQWPSPNDYVQLPPGNSPQGVVLELHSFPEQPAQLSSANWQVITTEDSTPGEAPDWLAGAIEKWDDRRWLAERIAKVKLTPFDMDDQQRDARSVRDWSEHIRALNGEAKHIREKMLQASGDSDTEGKDLDSLRDDLASIRGQLVAVRDALFALMHVADSAETNMSARTHWSLIRGLLGLSSGWLGPFEYEFNARFLHKGPALLLTEICISEYWSPERNLLVTSEITTQSIDMKYLPAVFRPGFCV